LRPVLPILHGFWHDLRQVPMPPAIAVLSQWSYLSRIRAAAYPGDVPLLQGEKRGYLSTLSERPWIPDT